MRLFLIVSIIAIISVPSLAAAQASDFVPRIFDYYGELSVDARYENNESTTNGRSTKITDTTLIEKFSFYSLGYVYHPNFITFRLNLAVGLREEKFTSTYSEVPFKTRAIDEYEFRMYVLPEHPYNLELFTVRRTPLTRVSLSGVRPVSTSYGAILKYDEKPLAGSLSYTHQTTEASPNTTESQTFSANGIWFIGPFVTSAGFQHSGSSTSSNETSSRNYSFFQNKFAVKDTKLLSKVEHTEHTRERPHTGSLDLKTFLWEERLDQKLPWNFEASLGNRYLEDTTKTGSLAEVTVNTRETRFELTHQLYASLRSLYSLSYTVSQYPQGETKTTTNSLGFAYTKKIPVGIVRASVSYRLMQTDRTGQALVTSEFHPASANGTDTFSLNIPGADESSIVIMVSTVVPPGDVSTFVELQQGIDYTVTPTGNTFLISILSVPVGVCQTTDCLTDPAYVYSFRVSYSLVSEDIRFDTTSYGGNLRFELFKNLLSPYFSYYRTTQELISGSLNGSAEDSTNTTVGLQVQKIPFIFLVEYQEITSNTNPSRALRSELNYRKDLTPSVSLSGKLTYSNIDYPLGQAGPTTGYEETRYGADVKVLKTFYSPRLAIVLGVSYYHSQGLATAKTYALNSGLSLRMGRTDLIFSGRATRSEIQGISAKQELTSEFFFLTFKRRFF